MYRTVAAVATCLLLVSTMATAQPRKDRIEMRMERRESVMDNLKLTDDQKSKIDKMRLDFRKKQIEQESKIRIARLDLKELITAETPDRGAIEKSLKSISDLQYQMKLARVDHLFAVRAILTPEQQKKWKTGWGQLEREHSMDRPFMRGGRSPMKDMGDD